MSAADQPAAERRGADGQPAPRSEGPSGSEPSLSPTGGAPDAADNVWSRASFGYQLAQMKQAAEAQRAEVLAAARAGRPDLSETDFAILVDQGFPLSVPFEATPDEVLAYLTAFHPVPRPPAQEPPKSWRRLRLEQALERLRAQGTVAPTQAEIADAITPQIVERTLRGWLAAEPALRALLPRRSRPRRNLPKPVRFST